MAAQRAGRANRIDPLAEPTVAEPSPSVPTPSGVVAASSRPEGPQRVPKRQDRRPRSTADRLVDEAIVLVEQEGSFSQISLRAVAAAAGVSAPAVYRHFADRAALIETVERRCWDLFAAEVYASVDPRLYRSSEDGTPLRAEELDGGRLHDQLRAAGMAYVSFAQRRPGIYASLFDSMRPTSISAAGGASGASPHVDPQTHVGVNVFLALADLIGAVLRANGDTREPVYVARLVHSWIHGIATLAPIPLDGVPDTPAMIDELAASLGLVPRQR